MRRCATILTALAVLAVLAALSALGTGGAAVAGPWPREAGAGFVAASIAAARAGGSPATEVYGEFGLAARITLGGALERGAHGLRGDLFARWHPPDLPGGWRWGLTGGLRATSGAPVRLRAMLGADLGRGFEAAAGNLWLRAGARALIAPAGAAAGRIEWDLSAQAGLRRGNWVGIAAVTRYHNAFGAQTRLRPALGRVLTPRLTLLAEAAADPGAGLESLRLVLWSRH